MKRLVALSFLAFSAPAFAHPGHVASDAGHSHWVALGATVAALAIVIVGIARGLRARRLRQRQDA